MEILIILIVILVVFYLCYLSSKNNKLTKTEAFNSQDYVIMYEHWDYGGDVFYCPIGHTSYETLNNAGWNDKASSIMVPEGLRAVFYEHSNRGGRSLTLGPGRHARLKESWFNPDFYDFGWKPEWNDTISSVDVFRV
jgi:hypothetical protein